jgi:hypothetical protein
MRKPLDNRKLLLASARLSNLTKNNNNNNNNNNNVCTPPGYEEKSILHWCVASASVLEEPLLIRSSSTLKPRSPLYHEWLFLFLFLLLFQTVRVRVWRVPGGVILQPAIQLANPLRECYPQVTQHPWRNDWRKSSCTSWTEHKH